MLAYFWFSPRNRVGRKGPEAPHPWYLNLTLNPGRAKTTTQSPSYLHCNQTLQASLAMPPQQKGMRHVGPGGGNKATPA